MSKTKAPAEAATLEEQQATAHVDAPAESVDTHAGKGGMYQIVNGRRELVERTAEHWDLKPGQTVTE